MVVNPRAANGRTGKHWERIASEIRTHLPEFDAEFTRGPGDAGRIAREALHAGYEMIVAVGGDGCINETVNGFFENGKPIRPDAVLGVLPRGTGGDFRKTIGISKEIDDCARSLSGRTTISCDAGDAILHNHDGKPVHHNFINILDFGMGGEVVHKVNHTTKIFGGFASFLIGTLRAQVSYRNQDVRIVIDGKDLGNRKIKSAVIANGQYFGGGMRVAKNARLDSGFFEFIVIGDWTMTESFANTKKFYSGDIIDSSPKVEYYRAREIFAEGAGRVLIDMDGEQPGSLPLTVKILPSAIRLKIPDSGV